MGNTYNASWTAALAIRPHHRLFTPRSTTGISHQFTVDQTSWVLVAYGLNNTQLLEIQMVSSDGTIFETLKAAPGAALTLHRSRNIMPLPVEGTYRVVLVEGSPGGFELTALPTTIPQDFWPAIASGNDVRITSPTGSLAVYRASPTEPTYTLDVSPIATSALIAASPAAMVSIANALDFSALNNGQKTSLANSISFGSMSGAQKTALADAIDFAGMSAGQKTAMGAALDFSGFSGAQKTALANAIDFAGMSSGQKTAMGAALDFSGFSGAQKTALADAIDFAGMSAGQKTAMANATDFAGMSAGQKDAVLVAAGSARVYDTVAAATAATTGVTITTIYTNAYATAGDGGGARYVPRVAPVPVAFTDAGGRAWMLDPTQPQIYVEMFGAVGDAVWSNTTSAVTGTDDTVAIQSAIDWCLQSKVPQLHFRKKYRTSATLHCGWGYTFETLWLIGTRPSYAGSNAGVAIYPTVTDRPAINFQSARGSGIRGIAICGANFVYINNNRVGPADHSPTVNDWVDTALQVTGTTPGGVQRYAPYAAITVDAYSGSAPSGGNAKYPDLSFPAWTGLTAQYGKPFSSDVTVEDVHVYGFCVGVCIAPNSPNQGDFCKIRNTWIVNCTYGISIGNHQSRNVEIRNIVYAGVHTLITNSTNGARSGVLGGPLENISGGVSYQLLDLDVGSYAQPITVKSFYCEAQVRIGRIAPSGVTSNTPVVFECINFGIQSAEKYIPAALVECGAGQHVSFRCCLLGTGRRITNLVSGSTSVVIEGCYFFGGLTSMTGANGTTAYRLAVNYTGGYLCPPTHPITDVTSSARASAVWLGHSQATYLLTPTGGLTVQLMNPEIKFSSSHIGSRLRVPLTQANTHFIDTGGRRWSLDLGAVQNGSVVLNNTGYCPVLPVYANDEITFTFANVFMQRHDTRMAVGNLLWNQISNTLFVVTSVTFSSPDWVVVAKQLNNLKVDSADNYVANLNSDMTLAGTTRVINTQYTIPQQVHYGTFTSGSVNVTSVQRFDGTAGSMASYLSAGDPMATYPSNTAITGWPTPYSGSSGAAPTIASVTNGVSGAPGSLTLSHAAVASGVFPIFPVPIR